MTPFPANPKLDYKPLTQPCQDRTLLEKMGQAPNEVRFMYSDIIVVILPRFLTTSKSKNEHMPRYFFG
jgi:hypothetical protein